MVMSCALAAVYPSCLRIVGIVYVNPKMAMLMDPHIKVVMYTL
jgi:hypothetical protein